MTKERSVEIYRDKDALASAAAEKVISLANAAIDARGSFTIALAGGSTPKGLYELLARDYGDKTNWSKWHIFIGDERLVPYDHPDSNYGMAKKALLDKVGIPEGNIYPIQTHLGKLAAQEYESTIKKVMSDLGIGGFDIILHGLGSDGHTLSLFPGKDAVLEKEKLVVATEHGVLPPPVDRITLTLPAVNAASLALFLVVDSDGSKSHVVREILEDEASLARPASLIVPTATLGVCWMLDQLAAAELTK